MKNQNLIYSLGLAGLIPFFGAAAAEYAGWSIVGINPQTVFLSYSAIILSFMGGTLWGKSRELPNSKLSAALLIFSNALTLLAWLMLLLGTHYYATGLSIAILAFTALYIVEWTNAKHLFEAEANAYLKLRLFLSTTVCLCHVVMLLM